MGDSPSPAKAEGPELFPLAGRSKLFRGRGSLTRAGDRGEMTETDQKKSVHRAIRHY